MFISDNHNNKGFSIPNIFKIFFKKYISIHNIERPDRLVLRIENMKKIIGDELFIPYLGILIMVSINLKSLFLPLFGTKPKLP